MTKELQDFAEKIKHTGDSSQSAEKKAEWPERVWVRLSANGNLIYACTESERLKMPIEFRSDLSPYVPEAVISQLKAELEETRALYNSLRKPAEEIRREARAEALGEAVDLIKEEQRKGILLCSTLDALDEMSDAAREPEEG